MNGAAATNIEAAVAIRPATNAAPAIIKPGNAITNPIACLPIATAALPNPDRKAADFIMNCFVVDAKLFAPCTNPTPISFTLEPKFFTPSIAPVIPFSTISLTPDAKLATPAPIELIPLYNPSAKPLILSPNDLNAPGIDVRNLSLKPSALTVSPSISFSVPLHQSCKFCPKLTSLPVKNLVDFATAVFASLKGVARRTPTALTLSAPSSAN